MDNSSPSVPLVRSLIKSASSSIPIRAPETDPGEPTARLVDLTPYYGHLACFRELRPLLVLTNPFTYAPSYTPNAQMQNTWLSIALEAIGSLHADRSPAADWGRVAVIGTGNGLDAVGISRIVAPQGLVASDIHPMVLPAARWNIARYAGRSTVVSVRQSDLFAGYPAAETFDLIYENLPNVPDDTELFEGIRSSSCYAPRAPSREWDRHLLTLHHEFLLKARSRLTEAGSVVCVIGGRIPAEVIHRMFRDAGYRSRIIGCGLKIQSEAEVVLPAYAAAESENLCAFAYYGPLAACSAIAREMPQPATLSAREDYARRLTERLRACRVSATEALRLHREGAPVCHTVFVVAGSLGETRQADG